MFNSVLYYILAKQEDDELVLQIVYVFHQLVQHNDTRTTVVKQSRILTNIRSKLLLHLRLKFVSI